VVDVFRKTAGFSEAARAVRRCLFFSVAALPSRYYMI
jgi:hypothetical protein